LFYNGVSAIFVAFKLINSKNKKRMPYISARGISMPASPIRKLVPLANRAKAKGIKVYHLNIGQPDLPTPQVAMDAMKRINRQVLEYSPSDGILSFREKLTAYYAKFNIDVEVDDIIVTTGGSEAVQFSFMACLDPGDEIIVPEPAYANYMAFAISSGAVIKTIPSSIEEGFALPSIEKFEELITPRTKGILICNPNNPTGYLYTQKEMSQIRDLVSKYDLFLFSDEVYREFCYTGAPYISAFHLKGIENNVVLIDSVSKRYSECGIRIGAIITKNRMVRENVMKWCQARLSPPLIGQIIAEASLDTPEEYMLEVYNEYLERRKFLVDGLNRIPGCYSPIPMGAFYTVAKLPIDDADKFCAWCLSDFEYEGQTVMMAPASGFYTTPGLGKDQVRIAYVLKKDDLAKALQVLAKALQAYNRTPDENTKTMK
jgi:aspartate aminotransferase